jgi:hypothetical protein
VDEETVEGIQEQETVETEQTSAETKKAEKEIVIPKSRFDEVNEKLKLAQKQLSDYEKQRKESELKAQEEQGRYRELYENAQRELEAQKKEVETLHYDSIRKEVATEAGFPSLWNRLQGSNREELETDMNSLLEAMPKPKAPPVNGAAGTGERNAPTGKMTKAEKEEFAALVGLNPQYLD